MKEQFIAAIHAKKKVRITFYSKEDGRDLTRLCAPMDYGPSRRTKDKTNRFHFWDYESDKQEHTLSLLQDQIKSIEVLEDSFMPDFVTWNTKTSRWHVKRDWGAYS